MELAFSQILSEYQASIGRRLSWYSEELLVKSDGYIQIGEQIGGCLKHARDFPSSRCAAKVIMCLGQ